MIFTDYSALTRRNSLANRVTFQRVQPSMLELRIRPNSTSICAAIKEFKFVICVIASTFSSFDFGEKKFQVHALRFVLRRERVDLVIITCFGTIIISIRTNYSAWRISYVIHTSGVPDLFRFQRRLTTPILSRLELDTIWSRKNTTGTLKSRGGEVEPILLLHFAPSPPKRRRNW